MPKRFLPVPSYWTFLVLLALCPFLDGCFIKSIAVDSIADSLSSAGDTYSSDNDPQLVRQALPFSLKLMESILAATPNHVGLLATTCKSFTEYAYAFVQMDSDELAGTDYVRSHELRSEAKKLYIRARDYGLRGLEVRHGGFDKKILLDPKGAVADANKDDVDLLYWTGVSWMAAISLGKDDPELVSDIPQAEALIYRAYALEPDYEDGTIEEFLITYEGSKPALMGGSAAKAKQHFDAALRINKGLSAATYVNYAQAVDVPAQNKDEFEKMLYKALAIDVDQEKSLRLVNLIMQEQAQWLLDHEDTLFVK